MAALLKGKNRTVVVRLLVTAALIVFSISMLLPLLWMLSASFKKPGDIWKFPVEWIPPYWYPDNYRYIFRKETSVFLMYFNSIKVTVINVFGSLLTSSLAAYAYARMKFKGKEVLFLTVLATLMIPNQVLYVPRFVMFRWLDQFIPMMNSHNALILPGLYAPLGMFLLRQFYMQVPNELSESAIIDGAGDLTIWWRIIMPISKPALATFAVIVFSHHWNDYETPLIFIRSRHLFTIPLGLANFADENGQLYHYIMALSTIAIIPLIIVFLAGQKQFIRGMIAGALKG
ncbi:carbohydrate ABC transporter permease [Capillibacterium thermochitinicola]|uniref:Carbohydrate ABC transporter permease n=1 Tax=Capillibacterium thermochitinicola TaxID=2699427 RepID=A0A8J6I257_9FIRM|nr:carbohydrate ABC transporter permease [Capillibacterium thermochitinicola]MBA2133873.1 carbohydrate ABC transporter permease [Capillibacterium thermochitinicola]